MVSNKANDFDPHGAGKPIGMLSDADIRAAMEAGDIRIVLQEHAAGTHFDLDRQLQLNAIDLHVGSLFRRFKLPEGCDSVSLQALKDGCTELEECPAGDLQRIMPGELLLATTRETIVLSDELSGMVVGRSSVGRMGIMVNCCTPLIKPGHATPAPLQLINLNPYPVDLNLDVALCQIVFFSLASPASAQYAELETAKYAKEGRDPSSSLLYKDDCSLGKTVSATKEEIRASESGIVESAAQIIRNPNLREVLWIFAGFTVVERLAGMIQVNLGDTLGFLQHIPLSLILGLLVLAILLFTGRKDCR